MKSIYVYLDKESREHPYPFPLEAECLDAEGLRWGYEAKVIRYPWEPTTPQELALNTIATIVRDASWCIDSAEGIRRIEHVLQGLEVAPA